MAFCGYKLSLCGLIISTWGFVQLLLMGALFFARSPAFLEDLPLEGPFKNTLEYLSAVKNGFSTNGYNCLTACLLYIVTMGISGWQFYLNQKPTYQV